MIRDKISTVLGFPIRGNYKASLNTLDVSGAVDKKKQLGMILALCEAVEELENFQPPTITDEPKPTNKKHL